MITGIGLDVCEIERMEKLMENGRFLARYFSEEEQQYIQSKGKSAPATMAGIYAAKEALPKALGTGIVDELANIVVRHNELGAPCYALHGEYARYAEDKRISSFYLSITHDGGVAAAVCVAERNA